jgi:hypothetical protein
MRRRARWGLLPATPKKLTARQLERRVDQAATAGAPLAPWVRINLAELGGWGGAGGWGLRRGARGVAGRRWLRCRGWPCCWQALPGWPAAAPAGAALGARRWWAAAAASRGGGGGEVARASAAARPATGRPVRPARARLQVHASDSRDAGAPLVWTKKPSEDEAALLAVARGLAEQLLPLAPGAWKVRQAGRSTTHLA